ncbi:bifunctional alpha,alpha-trehalose-phosphate synthase (UDP-forming)/trehalose-phosphatase [Mucilaginibacter myungsuensis]|uniref:Bifunctional alpha,alpha-trehalose-phosphate synthase (UDP-forming)/trehalose-phosphatase n=1 Tax=Mucilaginibacter myungsuensis TaxID=649104 RepID=A0A929L4K4_9SPHI|nr:bifunctional alpha,alpha-trehalose-phosphate synthase (UDP-forming)/trehalose-phosphatase [Mucilaginibacter myungsuensis]MBE9663900.1 bifunctional alpha,alpha-trehalose-phosphate synthase (UDP-forming)/trehalose-phosphatase [Mucilaginibacter myungsuensis]MDN3598384.1 bifunctional alpha,alpha-trehalose-phosphate synthase (UDP-forming)/trehalose-phosphatase [Mucilaginibacter myungsuensis]
MSNRLFIISNRLPVSIEETENNGYDIKKSSGGLVSAISSYLKSGGKEAFSEQIWAGFPDCSPEVWQKAHAEANAQSEYDYLPVFINKDDYNLYYNGFSNSLLWPLFHYFPSFAEYNDEDFETYMRVNRSFADAVIPQIRKDDMVWIHDYHVLPLAGMLREKFPDLSIGLFLHIPFPSYELFRTIPKQWQQALLSGMAGADLVGFHTMDYASHFLDCVEQVLKVEHEGQSFLYNGRRVKADAFPISIDVDLFHKAAESPEVRRHKNNYLELKGDKKLIFSVDRLDYTKGVDNRLKGYHKFLLDNPDYIGKVVFVLVIVPSRDEITKYAEQKKAIDEYIGNMNSSLGDIAWQPVLYHYNKIPFDEMVALYGSCDLALITPLRDGMNLVAKEFVATRTDKKGVLILSELAGAARELTDALLINPNDITEIAEAIKTGLEMPVEAQARRMEAMQACVAGYDVNSWATDLTKSLTAVKKNQSGTEVTFMDAFTRSRILENYAATSKRLLLLDYDGTLAPFAKEPVMARPDIELLSILEDIATDPENEVYLVSGRDSKTLDLWLGHLPLGLIAEHGATIKLPDGDWISTAKLDLDSWRAKIERVMNTYTLKAPGSFMEQKKFSLAWHYRNTDSFEGTSRAKELYEELIKLTPLMGLEVLNGNKVIEVREKGINKGIAVSNLVRHKKYDFILCAGDDRTDEDMFTALAKVPGAYTIKIGMEISAAKYNLQTPYMMRSFLQSVIDHPKKTIRLN